MKRLLFPLALALAVLAGCDDDPDPDTSSDTLADPIGDITVLGGDVLTTNEDHSGNADNQVDLFRYDTAGALLASASLNINGMGYLAAATDGQDIYLQARTTGQMFRTTPDGEVAWTRADLLAGAHALACGVTWRADLDSFVVLHRDPDTGNVAEHRFGPGFDGAPRLVRTIPWTLFEATSGLLAIAWHDGWLWALGRDDSGQAVIQGVDDAGSFTRFITLPGATACGLAADAGGLWVAYPDRRFERAGP